MQSIEDLLGKATSAYAHYQAALAELAQAIKPEPKQPQLTMLQLKVKQAESSKLSSGIRDLDRAMRQWLYARSLPNELMRVNCFLVPTSLIPEIHERLAQYSADRYRLRKPRNSAARKTADIFTEVTWQFFSIKDLTIIDTTPLWIPQPA